MKITSLVLSLAVLFSAPPAARAQSEAEKLSVGARSGFDGITPSFLKPSQLGRHRSATGFFAMTPGGPGFAGGIDVDFPARRPGGSWVIGLSGFGNTIILDKSQIEPGGIPGRIDLKAFGGGPTVGYRQKLFGLGLGKRLIVPSIAAGWSPFTQDEVGYLKHRSGRGSSTSQLSGNYDHIQTSGGWAPLTGYAAADVTVSLSPRCSVGVEARCYKNLLNPDPAAFLKTVGLTFTYTGKR